MDGLWTALRPAHSPPTVRADSNHSPAPAGPPKSVLKILGQRWWGLGSIRTDKRAVGASIAAGRAKPGPQGRPAPKATGRRPKAGGQALFPVKRGRLVASKELRRGGRKAAPLLGRFFKTGESVYQMP
jgi:hypothetical protein